MTETRPGRVPSIRHILWIESLEEGDPVRLFANGKPSPSLYTWVGKAECPTGVPTYLRHNRWCEIKGPRGGKRVTTIWTIRPVKETE